jgi:ComF family protein
MTGLVKAEQKCAICKQDSVSGWTHEGCKNKLGLDGVWKEYKYEAKMQGIVKAVKYRFCKELVGEVLREWQGERPFGEVDAVVPIPLHRLRENWRGFNQAEEIAMIVAEKWQVPIGKMLVRKKQTKPVAEMESREERVREIKGVFGLVEGSQVKGRRVILVDDVFTSGTTMKEAGKVLKEVGADWVGGWVLAG